MQSSWPVLQSCTAFSNISVLWIQNFRVGKYLRANSTQYPHSCIGNPVATPESAKVTQKLQRSGFKLRLRTLTLCYPHWDSCATYFVNDFIFQDSYLPRRMSEQTIPRKKDWMALRIEKQHSNLVTATLLQKNHLGCTYTIQGKHSHEISPTHSLDYLSGHFVLVKSPIHSRIMQYISIPW